MLLPLAAMRIVLAEPDNGSVRLGAKLDVKFKRRVKEIETLELSTFSQLPNWYRTTYLTSRLRRRPCIADQLGTLIILLELENHSSGG